MSYLLKISYFLLISLIIPFTNGCTRESKEIGACLHTYLERDFSAIEMFIYNKETNRKLGFEGPELEARCNDWKGVARCFTNILVKCKYMEDFFIYRDLLESVNKSLNYVCTHPYNNFKTLIFNIECIKTGWSVTCGGNPLNFTIWNKILRLEMGKEVCGDIISHDTCIRNRKPLQRQCSPEGVEVYNEVISRFLNNWCRNNASNNKTFYFLYFILFWFLINVF